MHIGVGVDPSPFIAGPAWPRERPEMLTVDYCGGRDELVK